MGTVTVSVSSPLFAKKSIRSRLSLSIDSSDDSNSWEESVGLPLRFEDESGGEVDRTGLRTIESVLLDLLSKTTVSVAC